jgi:hypothetical protein
MTTKILSFLRPQNWPSRVSGGVVPTVTVREASEQPTTITLTRREAVRLVELIENPPAPTKKYLEAKERHRRMKDAGARIARRAARQASQQEGV